MGLVAAMLAGFSFCLGHSISKSSTMTENNGIARKEFKAMASLTLSLIFASILLVILSLQSSSVQEQYNSINTDNLFAELFWIGVFSLTAKAALAISFDDNNSNSRRNSGSGGQRDCSDEENPVHCKIMCLVGLVYCGLVDRSLFAYDFKAE